MNIIFMRHGEATDNVKKLISDKEVYWSTLTRKGKETVAESIKQLPKSIDKIYVSPLPRTIETAHLVLKKYSGVEVIIDNRLHEITYGKYSGKMNSKELDEIRLKQIEGDYFTRFGEYGENKYDIELRLCEFLNHVYTNNFKTNTIMIISHGSIISYMKRILNIKNPHIKMGMVEEYSDVDFCHLYSHIKSLKKVKANVVKKSLDKIEVLSVNKSLKRSLVKFSKEEFNNKEYPVQYFSNFLKGLSTKNLKENKQVQFESGIILICFYRNFEVFAERWISHYINIGIKNFVLVNNNSIDNSENILKNYEEKANISFWKINEEYDYYKMCGWKQQIMEHFGPHDYLILNQSELLIYDDYKNTTFEKFKLINKASFVKGILLEVYSNKNLSESDLEDFKFIDKGTYKIEENHSHNKHIYGGPKLRTFGIHSNLERIPLISYTGKGLFISENYYYPWNINNTSKFCSYILNYEFLTEQTYNKKVMLYDENVSIPINKVDFSH